ncbi:MAG TPA: hypothetical protein VM580_02635, partial [Labilithrix sp.]|nr:hypothetical protein [Labilithrix sp.]
PTEAARIGCGSDDFSYRSRVLLPPLDGGAARPLRAAHRTDAWDQGANRWVIGSIERNPPFSGRLLSRQLEQRKAVRRNGIRSIACKRT